MWHFWNGIQHIKSTQKCELPFPYYSPTSPLPLPSFLRSIQKAFKSPWLFWIAHGLYVMYMELHHSLSPSTTTWANSLGFQSLTYLLQHHICYTLSQRDSFKPQRRECTPQNKWTWLKLWIFSDLNMLLTAHVLSLRNSSWIRSQWQWIVSTLHSLPPIQLASQIKQK